MQYKVKYWMNVDVIAEEIIDSENINMDTNDLGKYNEPTKDAKYKILNSIKINRRSYEKYDEKPNNSSKESSSDKWDKACSFNYDWFWNSTKYYRLRT